MKNQKAFNAYVDAYNRAMKALKDIENMIHDNPAPDPESDAIHWGNVGDMIRVAGELEDILPESLKPTEDQDKDHDANPAQHLGKL